jgi:hypothetical protein
MQKTTANIGLFDRAKVRLGSAPRMGAPRCAKVRRGSRGFKACSLLRLFTKAFSVSAGNLGRAPKCAEVGAPRFPPIGEAPGRGAGLPVLGSGAFNSVNLTDRPTLREREGPTWRII